MLSVGATHFLLHSAIERRSAKNRYIVVIPYRSFAGCTLYTGPAYKLRGYTAYGQFQSAHSAGVQIRIIRIVKRTVIRIVWRFGSN